MKNTTKGRHKQHFIPAIPIDSNDFILFLLYLSICTMLFDEQIN